MIFPPKDTKQKPWDIRGILEYLLGYCGGRYSDDAIAEAEQMIKNIYPKPERRQKPIRHYKSVPR